MNHQNQLEPGRDLDLPPAHPYTSTHQHLKDLLGRCGDLLAAQVGRGPRSTRQRGIDRAELLARSQQRSHDEVPLETRMLWRNADLRLRHIQACEAMTELDLPVRRIQRTFGLSALELDALLLVAAAQLDASFAAEWEGVTSAFSSLSVRTVIAVLGRTFEEQLAIRRLFAADAPLFAGSVLLAQRVGALSEGDFLGLELEVPRRIVSELLGDGSLDDSLVAFSALKVPKDRLSDLVLPLPVREMVLGLVVGHEARLARCSAWGLDEVVTHGRATVLLFTGPPGTGKTMLAHAVAREAGRKVYAVDLPRLVDARDVESNLDAVLREAKLQNAVIFFDEAEQIFASRLSGNSLMQLLLTRLEQFDGIAILATNLPEQIDEAMWRRVVARVELPLPSGSARTEIWRKHLPAALPVAEDVDVVRLGADYELSGGTIKNAVLAAVQSCIQGSRSEVTMADLVSGARLQQRLPVHGNVRLREASQALSFVVLPARTRARVDGFIVAAREEATVLREWGLGRTLGLSGALVALFVGPPGVGKTMTAEAIAHSLARPLLSCDLTTVVSKWVGDTAKNLRELFEAARQQRAVLVFDEADALFACRTESGTAMDRAQNAETGALLGLLDTHEGVVVLTTNRGGDIDPAFARRVHSRIEFDHPDVHDRARLWRRLLESETPVADDIDPCALAERFKLSGAAIRSAIVSAARAAASQPSGARYVTQRSLLEAAAEQLEVAPTVAPSSPLGN